MLRHQLLPGRGGRPTFWWYSGANENQVPAGSPLRLSRSIVGGPLGGLSVPDRPRVSVGAAGPGGTARPSHARHAWSPACAQPGNRLSLEVQGTDYGTRRWTWLPPTC